MVCRTLQHDAIAVEEADETNTAGFGGLVLVSHREPRKRETKGKYFKDSAATTSITRDSIRVIEVLKSKGRGGGGW